MYNIGICDDELFYIEKVKSVINKYFIKSNSKKR